MRDPIIDKTAAILRRGLKSQLRALLTEALPRIRHAPHLREADDNERAIQEVISGLRALSDSISLEAYGELLKKAILAGANQSGSLIGKAYRTWPERLNGWIKDHAFEKIGKDLDRVTIEQLRGVLQAGIEESKSYQAIARDIRSLGAFSRQRAQTIAVTEMGNAFSQGTLGGALDLQDAGLGVEKSWLSQGDCCDICDGNSAEGWIDADAVFKSGDQAPLAHPNCRCALLTRVLEPSFA